MVNDIRTYRLTRYIDNKRLAQLLGVSYTQFKKMLKGDQDIRETMENCNEEIATEIKASIYQRAMGYEAQDIEILACFDSKGNKVNNRLGQHLTIKISTKHIPADMTAAKMALDKLDPSWAEGGQGVIIHDDIKDIGTDSAEVSRDLELEEPI
jgi:myo-inositol-1-phosphate synthase